MQFVNLLSLAISLLPLRALASPVPDSVDTPGQEARSITTPDARSVNVERDGDLEPYAVPIPIEVIPTKRATEEMTERDTSADKLFARECLFFFCVTLHEDISPVVADMDLLDRNYTVMRHHWQFSVCQLSLWARHWLSSHTPAPPGL